MFKFLSIITINLNNAEGLDKTIASVVSQTYKNFEFIIIDGCSKDNSLEIINRYKEQINFWVSENDKGIYQAMNKGINLAKGSYLLFLNSGDILNGKYALETFINHKNFRGDIIYGNYKFEEGEKIYPAKLTPLHFFKSSLPHQSSLIKKELFSSFGLYNEDFKIVSDKAFFIKCFLSNNVQFSYVDFALSIADLSGISNTNYELVKNENDAILKFFYSKHYEDYINYINLERNFKNLQKETLKGILKKIKSKFFK
jgi:glycosyltransferase involved in cell wall biosynthesis